MNNRKLILYIATSLDGYIAGPEDDLSFLDVVQKKGEDYGYHKFIANIDTIIIGRRTYDWVMNKIKKFPHDDLESYVITRRQEPDTGNLHFYSGDIRDLVTKLKNNPGKNIFCDGGAEIVNILLRYKLLDELIISVVPILLGDGIRLFNDARPVQELKLLACDKYDTGLVQLHYRKEDR